MNTREVCELEVDEKEFAVEGVWRRMEGCHRLCHFFATYM
jgi:hypothetical protein